MRSLLGATFVAGILWALLIGTEVQARDIPGQSPHRYFTVTDSIHMARFARFDEESQLFASENYSFSPDKRYFVVVTSRGILRSDTIESTLWLFTVSDVRKFLRTGEPVANVQPKPIARLAAIPRKNYTIAYEPMISDVRWQPDSKAVLFLGQNSHKERQLYRVEVPSGVMHALTPAGYDVSQFDSSGNTTVYVAAPSNQPVKTTTGNVINADTRDLTGLSLESLVPEPPDSAAKFCELWVIRNGRSWRLREHDSGRVLHLANHFPDVLSISPDGRSVALLLPANRIPASWGLFKPSLPYLKLRPGESSSTSLGDFTWPMQYVVFNVDNATEEFLMDAPDGYALGYVETSKAIWTANSAKLLLTNTFLPLESTDENGNIQQLKPCAAAVVDVGLKSIRCVAFSQYTSANRLSLVSASFGVSVNDIALTFSKPTSQPKREYYRYGKTGWYSVGIGSVTERTIPSILVEIREGLNNPPALWATDRATKKSWEIWNPNPQFALLQFGKASLVRWKDRSGYEWVGQLIEPPDFIDGKRYPLVIQTYGFPDGFVTDGFSTTAYAARPLASVGIMVLMIQRRTDHYATSREASDQIMGYESAIKKLSSDGLIDSTKVGIIGFSRTCYHVESALIQDPRLFAAASIADGFTANYTGYLYDVKTTSGVSIEESIYGAKPFGAGLRRWVARSPGFNSDRIQTPVLLTAATLGFGSILGEWETYSSLLAQRKPVDFMYFPYSDHVLQTPLERLASEQGNVDWFRFWLQGYEDPDPAKAAEYARWRGLRRLSSLDRGTN